MGRGKGQWDPFPGGSMRKTKVHILHSFGTVFAKLYGTVLQLCSVTSKNGNFAFLQKETSFDFSPEKVFFETVVPSSEGSTWRAPGWCAHLVLWCLHV